MRVLFVSDTHLGLDLPARPRVVRRRRGHDFFENFERALAGARNVTLAARLADRLSAPKRRPYDGR